MGDEETIREIIPSYVDDISAYMQKLCDAVGNKDCVCIASVAHAIKGVGRNLGIAELSEMAGKMESANRQNDFEAGQPLFGGINSYLERIVDTLSKPDWIETIKIG